MQLLKSFNESKSLKKGKTNKSVRDNENHTKNSMRKISSEMSEKFYLRNREGYMGIGKSNDLYSGFIKDPRKIINKILLDYKNIKKYDKEELLFNNIRKTSILKHNIMSIYIPNLNIFNKI